MPDELLEADQPRAAPRATCKERIAAFNEAGVTMLNVTPIGADSAALIEQLKAWTA